MIMNMSPVHMRRHNKRMLPLGESHTSFISYFICFLRCNLSGLKGLADLISNDISIWLSPRFFQIIYFRLCKFPIDKIRLTHIRRNIFSVFCFLSILCIIGSVFQTLHHGTSLILMHCYQFCRRHSLTCLT